MDTMRLIGQLDGYIRQARDAARAGKITTAEEHLRRLQNVQNKYRPPINEQKRLESATASPAGEDTG